MDDLSRLFRWMFARFVGPTDEPDFEPSIVAARLGHRIEGYPQEPMKVAAE
jgi:hypothetical protein